MGKRRNNVVIIPLALLFFAILGLNVWVFKSTARTNSDKTVVEHTQLEFFVPDKRILLQAVISDPTGIAEARLYFGASVKNLVFSEMVSQEGDSYVGIIPAPSSKTDKIFYSILAVNYNGDVTKTGLFELQASKDVGFIPTWQGDLDEYGKTLILGKESTLESPSTSLEGFADSIIVNAVTPEERYFLAKKVERVAGLSTIDGGDVEPSEEAGEEKGKWSRKKKAVVIGGAILGAGAIGGGIAALSGGGGGGGHHKRPVEDCTNGIDDDGDGKIDCADPDCVNPPCGPEIGPERCSDGVDNDGDGLVDCNDPDCRVDADNDEVLAPPCGNDCNDNDPNNFPGNAENCTDGKDNDCDVLVDCADPNCSNNPACIPNVPDQQVEDGNINFNPNTGQVGDPVGVSVCFDETQGLASGWHIEVRVDGENKRFEVCNTLGSCTLDCDLGQILKFSRTNHTVIFRVNWETGPVKLFEGSLPLEFQ